MVFSLVVDVKQCHIANVSARIHVTIKGNSTHRISLKTSRNPIASAGLTTCAPSQFHDTQSLVYSCGTPRRVIPSVRTELATKSTPGRGAKTTVSSAKSHLCNNKNLSSSPTFPVLGSMNSSLQTVCNT